MASGIPTEVRIADAARALNPSGTSPAAPVVGRSRFGPAPAANVEIVAEGFRVLGVGELGGRLPIALLSLLTLLGVYFVGRSVLRPRAALFGALTLLTLPSFLFGARQLTSATPLLFASVLTLGGLIYWVWPPAGLGIARIGGLVAAGLGAWLGVRAGGVLEGAVAPIFAVALAEMATRERGRPPSIEASKAWLTALVAVATAIVLVVLGVLAWRHRGIFSLLLAGSPRPVQYQTVITTLLRQIGFASAPWLAIVPFAILRALDGELPAREGDAPDRALFARALWPALLAMIYFAATLQEAAVAEVLAPAALPVALLCGAYLDDLLERPELRAVEGITVLLFAIVLGHDLLLDTDAFVTVQTTDTIRWPPAINYTADVLFGAVAAFGVVMSAALLVPAIGPLANDARRTRVQRGLVLGTIALQLAFAFAVVQWFIPAASKHLSPRDLYGKTKQLDAKAPLGQYHFNSSGAQYYMNGRTATNLNTLDDLLNFLRRPERVFVFVGSEELASIDQAARAPRTPAVPGTPAPAPTGAPTTNYFVVDDSNSHFLILSNHLQPAERDLNPLRRLVSSFPPAPKVPVKANFEDKLELLGYDLPAEASRGGDILVRLYFKVLQPVGGSYKVFLHFDGPGSRVNGDHVPLDGRFPTQFWSTGTYVTDEYLLKPDRATEPTGLFQLYFGFFSGDRRLKVKEGPSDGENRVRLGSVHVQ